MENKPSQSTNTETNKAYQEMLGLILDGKLKLGEKISRRKMAELVNTSVIPSRRRCTSWKTTAWS
jgi:DNA-binding GntR family transcriptional regulator